MSVLVFYKKGQEWVLELDKYPTDGSPHLEFPVISSSNWNPHKAEPTWSGYINDDNQIRLIVQHKDTINIRELPLYFQTPGFSDIITNHSYTGGFQSKQGYKEVKLTLTVDRATPFLIALECSKSALTCVRIEPGKPFKLEKFNTSSKDACAYKILFGQEETKIPLYYKNTPPPQIPEIPKTSGLQIDRKSLLEFIAQSICGEGLELRDGKLCVVK